MLSSLIGESCRTSLLTGWWYHTNPADPTKVLVQEVAHVGKCSRGFAQKCIDEIEGGNLVNPRLNGQRCNCGDGVFTISEDDGLFLLALRKENNRWTLCDYCICMIVDQGVFVSPSVICKWFNHIFCVKVIWANLIRFHLTSLPQKTLWKLLSIGTLSRGLILFS